MLPAELLLATRSAGKTAEFRDLLAAAGVRVLSLHDVGLPELPEEAAVEVGATFAENARLKASYFRRRIASRYPVLADDSGLSVHVLGGAPGVHSRRYAGAIGSELHVSRTNVAKLLRALDGVNDRAAEFACALAYADDAREVVCEGRTAGRILSVPTGTEGFGYDPVFWSADLGRSFGEASRSAKEQVSHRARAIGQLLAALAEQP